MSKLNLNMSFLNGLTNINNNSSINNENKNLKTPVTPIQLLKKYISNKNILNIAEKIYKKINKKTNKNNLSNINNFINRINHGENIGNKISNHRKGKHEQNFKLNYRAFTYKYNGKIIKIYNYNNDINLDALIIKEIAFQIYADTLDCEFLVPSILNYGKIILDHNTNNSIFTYDTIFYIEMEYIEYDTLKKFINKLKINNIHSICNELSDKINSIIDCMEYYDIYHNDLHPDNILINYNKKNGIFKIYIIDFGESSNSLIKFNNVKYNCQKINLYITPININ
jgi:hypothetical protein